VPFSIRLDPETEALIRRLGYGAGRSKSAVVREAVARYAADAGAAGPAATRSAFDRLKPFAGVVRTEQNYSRDTHAKYRALLRRRHDRRSR